MADYANPSALTDTGWLEGNLDNPDVVVIEMDTDPAAYEAGHIPGSVFWPAVAPLDETLSTLSDPGAISNLFESAGIRPSTTVILVHGQYQATSGWLYWFFKRAGHRDVRVLNGGRQKWLADGHALTDAKTFLVQTNYRVDSVDLSASVAASDVAAVIADANVAILDVRSFPEFTGDVYLSGPVQPDEVAGHIPGAIHFPYELVHDEDGTFKSAASLEKLYADKGITRDKRVLPYCAVGGRSAHTWFVLTQLIGFKDVQNFDGSWREWSTTPGLPIAR